VNRIDRLTGILIRLQGQGQTARQLADRFEVSQRTILRDIDALCEIGVPIIASAGRHGGYTIAAGFWLPPLHLTPEEATVLLLALDHLGDEASSPLGTAHRTVLEKLRSILRPATRAEVDSNLESVQVVREAVIPSAATLAGTRLAVQRRQWMEIAYAGVDGSSVRTILPILVYVASGRWYVRAIDAGRVAVRHFRVDRIEHIRAVVVPADADALTRQALSQAKRYADETHPEVRARLSPKGMVLALDHPDLRAAVVSDGNGGRLAFRCPPDELPYYGRELLRFGPEVTVEAPEALRRWMTGWLDGLILHHQVGLDP